MFGFIKNAKSAPKEEFNLFEGMNVIDTSNV